MPDQTMLLFEVGRFFLEAGVLGIALWKAITQVVGNHIKHIHDLLAMHSHEEEGKFDKLDADLNYVKRRVDQLYDSPAIKPPRRPRRPTD